MLNSASPGEHSARDLDCQFPNGRARSGESHRALTWSNTSGVLGACDAIYSNASNIRMRPKRANAYAAKLAVPTFGRRTRNAKLKKVCALSGISEAFGFNLISERHYKKSFAVQWNSKAIRVHKFLLKMLSNSRVEWAFQNFKEREPERNNFKKLIYWKSLYKEN